MDTKKPDDPVLPSIVYVAVVPDAPLGDTLPIFISGDSVREIQKRFEKPLALCDITPEASDREAAGSTTMASGDDSPVNSDDDFLTGTQHVSLSDDSDGDGPGVLNPVDRMPVGLPRTSTDAPMLADDVIAQVAGAVSTGSLVPKKEEEDQSSGHAAAGSSSQDTSAVKQEGPSDLAAARDKRGSPGGGDDPPAKRPAEGLTSAIMQSSDLYFPNLCWPTRREGSIKPTSWHEVLSHDFETGGSIRTLR